MERTVPFLQGCISFVAFIVSFTLIVYMLVVFVAGMFDIALALFETVFTDTAKRQSIFSIINVDFLHTIGFLVVLMKLHSVLTNYMRHHVVSVQQIAELAIVACVLELLFNSAAYSDHMQLLLVGFATAMFGIYAFRYQRDLLNAFTQPAAAVEPEEAVVRAVRPRMLKEKVVLPEKPVRRVRKLATK